jgi:hypothetical protein
MWIFELTSPVGNCAPLCLCPGRIYAGRACPGYPAGGPRCALSTPRRDSYQEGTDTTRGFSPVCWLSQQVLSSEVALGAPILAGSHSSVRSGVTSFRSPSSNPADQATVMYALRVI